MAWLVALMRRRTVVPVTHTAKQLRCLATVRTFITHPRASTAAREHSPDGDALSVNCPPGSAPRAWHFPNRNRILAGLVRGVVVVQAEAAQWCVDYGAFTHSKRIARSWRCRVTLRMCAIAERISLLRQGATVDRDCCGCPLGDGMGSGTAFARRGDRSLRLACSIARTSNTRGVTRQARVEIRGVASLPGGTRSVGLGWWPR